MTNPYNVGDEVRIIHTDYDEYQSQQVGKIRTVVGNDHPNGVWLDLPEEEDRIFYFRSEIERVSPPTTTEFEIPFIEVSKRLRIEPFVLETQSLCEVEFDNSPLGGVKMHIDNELAWDAIDLRHFAVTLNALADKMEEAENA